MSLWTCNELKDYRVAKVILSAIILIASFRAWAGCILVLQLRTWDVAGRSIPDDEMRSRLLGSQETFLDLLENRLTNFDLTRPGPLIGVRGRWGSGKSFLLDQLKIRLDKTPEKKPKTQTVVVPINIWRDETVADLHFSIARTILAHKTVREACFSEYPPTMAFASAIEFIRQLLPNGGRMKFQFYGAALDASLAVPMNWQAALDAASRCWSAKGIRVIVIMDEIDRATPPMAQAAITLCRRALELPGIAVILPYVEDQLWFKVFNPVQNCSPDLMSTMLATIEEDFPLTLEEFDSNSIGGFSITAKQLNSRTIQVTSSSEGEEGKQESGTKQTDDSLASKLRTAYFRKFLAYDRSDTQGILHRSRLYRRFSEKYLSTILDVPRLTRGDVADVLSVFPALLTISKDLIGNMDLRNLLIEMIGYLITMEKLEAIRQRRPLVPSIRSLEGRLDRSLSVTKTNPFLDSAYKDAGDSSYFIKATIVLLTYLSAALDS